jgi:DNA segregation ATPase FtsK/SpoIIIE-like protein
MALVIRGWGFEALLALGVVLLWHATVSLDGEGLAVLVLGSLCLAIWRSEFLRRRLLATLRDRSTRRWLRRVLVACEVISRHGMIPRLQGSEVIPAGQRLDLKMVPGLTAEHLDAAAETLAAAIGARDVRVVREPTNASVVHLSILWRDPLAGPAPAWPGVLESLWDPLALGVDEDGRAVGIGLVERNVLLGGEPGAGKSAALSLFIAAAALDPEVRLTLLDGKQVELAPWAGSAEHFVGPDMGDAICVLKDLCAEMDRRYSCLLASGLRKIERGGDFGLSVIAIDELAFYMRSGTKEERSELSEALRDLISRGRAAGMIVVAATQKPSSDIVPTYVRDLFSFRCALRCTTPEASDTILGQGWAKEGYSASTLDPTLRGVGWLLAEGAVPVKIRTHYLDDDAIAELADIAAARRRAR